MGLPASGRKVCVNSPENRRDKQLAFFVIFEKKRRNTDIL